MAQLIEIWKVEERRFWWLLVLFLFVGVMSYYSAEQLLAMLRQSALFAPLQEILQDVMKNPTFVNTFMTIYLNNFHAALSIIGLGLFLGIGPILSLMGNSILLGLVLHISYVETEVHPIWSFITQVLPHGILELPVIIFAAAVGVHLGWLIIKGIGSWMMPEKRNRVANEWRLLLQRLPIILSILTVFLLVAAVIESLLIVMA